MDRSAGFQTTCIHGGSGRNPLGHVAAPICQSTSFEFPDTAEGARRAGDIAADEFYGRWGSTNAREFEALVASLEGADAAVCASSGLAIISMVAHAFLNPGDHLLAVHQCYSETKILLESLARQMSVEATFVDSANLRNFADAIRPNTTLVFVETPANPALGIVDIAGVAELVRGQSTPPVFAVDSTFATPYNQHPLSLGADVVLHSATKYLGGHSDVVAGVSAGKADPLWRIRERFSYHGPHLDPFAAWLLSRGVRTLGLRMQRHNENALVLATFLESHGKVERVYYPMLPSHPQHALAARQMTGGGGMICFEVRGGMDAALQLISSVETIKLAVSLGGVTSLITHPASMTHNLLPREEREAAGITDGMLRFSVGVEDAEDLQTDLEKALAAT
jgi:methionine-gamma-lyase